MTYKEKRGSTKNIELTLAERTYLRRHLKFSLLYYKELLEIGTPTQASKDWFTFLRVLEAKFL